MANFATGFAEGFNRSFLQTEQMKAQKEQDNFRYYMEELKATKTKRDAQKEQETLWKRQAEMMASEVNDPSFAGYAYKNLSNGYSYDKMLQEVREGKYAKDPNYKAPPSTVTIDRTTPMPQGVLGSNRPASAPMPEMDEATAKSRQRAMEVAPSLVQAAEEESNTAPYEGLDTNGWKYQNTEEFKMRPLDELMYLRETALQANDLVKARDYDMQIRMTTAALALEKKAEADAEGLNTKTFVQKNKDGTLSWVTGIMGKDEDGKPVVKNLAGDNVYGNFNVVPDAAIENYMKVAKDVGTKSTDYYSGATSFISFLDTVNTTKDLLAQYPQVTTGAAGIAVTVKSLQNEVQGVYDTLAKTQQAAELALEKGKMEEFMKQTDTFNKTLRGVLSKPVSDLAEAKALYESLRVQAAMQAAAAYGITGSQMSNAEYTRFYEGTGGGRGPEEVLNAMYVQGQSGLTKLKATAAGLNQNPQIKFIESMMGGPGSTDLSATKIPKMIERMDIDPALKQKYLQTYFEVEAPINIGQEQAVQSYSQGDQPAAGAAPTVGQVITGKGGKQYRYKGGNPADRNSYEEVK